MRISRNNDMSTREKTNRAMRNAGLIVTRGVPSRVTPPTRTFVFRCRNASRTTFPPWEWATRFTIRGASGVELKEQFDTKLEKSSLEVMLYEFKDGLNAYFT